MKFPIVLVLSLAAVAVAACGNTDSLQNSSESSASQSTPASKEVEELQTPTPSPTETLATYQDLVGSDDITTVEICESYSAILDKYEGITAKRLARLAEVDEDPYRAASLVSKSDWVSESLAVQFTTEMSTAATDALNQLSNGKAGTLKSIDPYLEASVTNCGYSLDLSAVRASVDEVDDEADLVVAAALNKPWYPKGYEEWIDGVAFKYNASASRNSSLCGWAYNVKCRDGCPNGLYVEVNFEDRSGTIVDYGNDYIPRLLPGDTALIQLRVGSRCGNVDSFSVTEVNCR